MPEIKEDGYVSLRTFITSNWNTVSIRDGQDEEIKKLSFDGNKVKWTHQKETKSELAGFDKQGRPYYDEIEYESNQELEITIILKGSDFPLPSTVSRSVILHEHDGKKDEISCEDFQPFTFENVNDELTIKHKIQVPAVG